MSSNFQTEITTTEYDFIFVNMSRLIKNYVVKLSINPSRQQPGPRNMDLPLPQSMYKLQFHQKLVGLRELRPMMSVLEKRNKI